MLTHIYVSKLEYTNIRYIAYLCTIGLEKGVAGGLVCLTGSIYKMAAIAAT